MSRIPRNLNFLGETAFLRGIFCLEYPSRLSERVNCHFLNYRLSFRKLQIFISQTADFHFANYRFSFRKLQIFISQTTDFHFANYRFSFRLVPFHFAPFRFANYSKPYQCFYKDSSWIRIHPHLVEQSSKMPLLYPFFHTSPSFLSFDWSLIFKEIEYEEKSSKEKYVSERYPS